MSHSCAHFDSAHPVPPEGACPSDITPQRRRRLLTECILVLAGLGVLTFGVYPIPLIDAAQRATNIFA